MPWKECHVVDERLRFIARLLDGETMTSLCTEFGISRKTGYKIYDRYKDCGLQGLTDRSRRPRRHANQLPVPIEQLIVRLKKKYPSWGAPKIREKLRPQCAPLRSGRAAVGARGSPVRPCRGRPSRTPCGVPTTKGNSCWRIGGTAIR
jgi:hypothetical protein